MTIIAGNQLNTTIGKFGIFTPRKSLNCTQYAGGLEAFDTVIDPDSMFAASIPTNIHLRPGGIEISIMHKFKLHKLGLRSSDIVSVHIENKDSITENKEKSVIGRALVGGLFFGPIGAIIGGLTGIGTERSIIIAFDIILTLTYLDNGVKKAAVFTCKHDKKAALYKGALSVFGSKLML